MMWKMPRPCKICLQVVALLRFNVHSLPSFCAAPRFRHFLLGPKYFSTDTTPRLPLIPTWFLLTSLSRILLPAPV